MPLNFPVSISSREHSPFVIGPPITEPRQFFGRDHLLRRIFGVWKHTPVQHIAIVGLKRSGKTSLLHYLKRIIDTPAEKLRPYQRNDWLMPGYQWVFVDFQDPRMCQQENLLRYIITELDIPQPEPCNLINFMEAVDQYLDIPTVILLDEITAGMMSENLDEQFWWGLRSLGSHHSFGKIGFLLSAHESPEQMTLSNSKPSPFFNIFGHVLNLGPLTEEEARELVDSSPLPFSESDIEWILTQTHRWPVLLQMFCYLRLVALEEGEKNNAWQKESLDRMKPYHYLIEQA
jgi:hypothetical protein